MNYKILTVDFETRSKCDLKKAGAWRYAEDRSTVPLCMAFKEREKKADIYIPPVFKDIPRPENARNVVYGDTIIETLERYIREGYIFEAHNAEFERAIWSRVMVQRYGWPEVPLRQWRCSAALAASRSLPRALNEVCKALALPVNKDMDGHMIMLRLSKPKKPSKKDPGIWDNDPAKLKKLFEYCVQDVNSEEGVSEALGSLDAYEQEVWFMDQKINERGIPVDVIAINSIIDMMAVAEHEMIEEIKDVTKGEVTTPRGVTKMIDWMDTQGVKAGNLQKATVESLLEKDIPDNVRSALEIRQSLSKSSTAKYKRMLDMVCDDERIRGGFMYHGAGTGRWSGKGIQAHNFPRGTYPDPDNCIKMIDSFDYDLVEACYEPLTTVASKLLRPMICAPPGKDLVCADYSSIEMVVLAWLAVATPRLQAIRSGTDLYKVAASSTYGVPYEEVTKDQRQTGKVEELALGYQGSWRAFYSMAKAYGVKPPSGLVLAMYPTKKGASDKEYKMQVKQYKADWYHNGKLLSKEEALYKKWASPIVSGWRDDNPEIRQFWYDMDYMVIDAVATGKRKKLRNIKAGVADGFLFIRLPSGRKLAYYDPQIRSVKMPWTKTVVINGEEIEEPVYKDAVTYMSVESFSNKWVRKVLYGGLLVENVVQATARDLLVHGMFMAEENGYPIIMHVHDEIVAEITKGYGSLENFEKLMSSVPNWAIGCPVSADGWLGRRYRK